VPLAVMRGLTCCSRLLAVSAVLLQACQSEISLKGLGQAVVGNVDKTLQDLLAAILTNDSPGLVPCFGLELSFVTQMIHPCGKFECKAALSVLDLT
jgi:hypothetical protein